MKRNDRIGGVMVVYYPDRETVTVSAYSLASQVDVLYVIDNTPDSDNSEMFRNIPNVEYISLRKNLGIAAAQNIGVLKLTDREFDFVLFSDQDSVAQDGIIEVLYESFQLLSRGGEKVGVVGPSYINKKTGVPYPQTLNDYVEVEMNGRKFIKKHTVISSFSLVSLELFRKVGMFREDLFMDYVENEWHFRLRSIGMDVFQSEDAVIAHEFGTSKVFLGRQISIATPSRLACQLRNFQMLRHLDYVPRIWRRFVWRHQLKKLLYYPVVPANRLEYIKAICQGLKDGINGKLRDIVYPYDN